MLEFIVLGKVPGTHFNITYSWVLALAAGLLIMLEIRYHRNYVLKVQAATAAAIPKTATKTSSTRRTKAKKSHTASKSAKTTPASVTRKSTSATRK